MRLALVGLIGVLLAGMATGETPVYLWAEVPVQTDAVTALPARAAALEIPRAVWQQDGLFFIGVKDEAELLGREVFLFLDAPYFLLVMQTQVHRASFRGNSTRAELISGGDSDVVIPPPTAFFDLLQALGLLSPDCTVGLTTREVAMKLPKPPEGIKLDPVLWGLVVHPNWIRFANDHALERIGLRVRVVAEVTGALPEKFEPYIRSSATNLVELLIPIPLLPELAQQRPVNYVRPPHIPYPAG